MCLFLYDAECFDSAEHRTSSMFFRVDQCFDFVTVNAKNITLHKYTVQNGRSKFRAILEIVGSSALNPSQNSLNNFKNKS